MSLCLVWIAPIPAIYVLLGSLESGSPIVPSNDVLRLWSQRKHTGLMTHGWLGGCGVVPRLTAWRIAEYSRISWGRNPQEITRPGRNATRHTLLQTLSFSSPIFCTAF